MAPAPDQPTQGRIEPADPARQKNPGDQAPPGTPGTGENVCPVCAGRGVVDGNSCNNCAGTGKITVGIGGA